LYSLFLSPPRHHPLPPSFPTRRSSDLTLHADSLDVRRGRGAQFPVEGAREVARAHAGALGECRHREVLAEVHRHPVLELAQRRALGGWTLQRRAELRLTTGPLEEENEPAGDVAGQIGPQVLLDERECEVDAGRDA